ncbi:M23 family metallopeptidase [Chryseolinea soli]|uniref:M23 family metallopeptidase n=1 Tax=Chryseolinea soli TaxID=2321403 RepID=A0A385SRF4_9BACT|nr:M23 family metallopeptidase [Chryseolinea soli]AYB31458.1 M23 family metallopeptidase [Chryseolinea soli]
MKYSKKQVFAFIVLAIIAVGFWLPQHVVNPVAGADRKSYHPKSFWYYPWGKSGTHKGVDIFAKEGTAVSSATGGWVIYTGELKMGGNVVLILGPKWRVHYYAHLQRIDANIFSWAHQGEQIGTVGTTGNAKGKPAHLHYSIATLIPYPWRMDTAPQGWKKMFYLNPIEFLNP